MTPDYDAEPGTRAPARLRRNLQPLTAQGDGVVRRDDALLFVTENRVEIGRAERHEGARGLAGRPGKGGVVMRQKHLGHAAFAASSVVICARRSSLTSRSWNGRLSRSGIGGQI